MPFIRPLWLSLFLAFSLFYISMRLWFPQPWDGAIKIIPILMLIQLGYSFTSGRTRALLMIALTFSLIGDLLLSLEGMFVQGLGAFLLAQLTYTTLFLFQSNWQSKRVSWITAVLSYTGLCVVFVLPHTGSMQMVITAYLCAITCMALTAGTRSDSQFWWCGVGAFIFMISDTLIAVNSFIQPFVGSGLAIMSTYYLAQLLITAGIIRHYNSPENSPENGIASQPAV